MLKAKRREWVFLAIVVVAWLFVLNKSVDMSFVDQDIKMVISQNKSGLRTLDDPRDIVSTKELYKKRLEFFDGSILRDSEYGKLGYRSNFFIDFDVDLEILKSAEYLFRISSDDGFRLFIDGSMLCEFVTDRPVESDVCSIYLTKGTHVFRLNYFQGAGNLGLRAELKAADQDEYALVGEDSDYVEYRRGGGEEVE